MYFKGDVIITDPCNIVKSDEDWRLVLVYHPEFDDYEKWPGSCAVIREFEGEIVLEEQEEEIVVTGSGNINFYTEQ